MSAQLETKDDTVPAPEQINQTEDTAFKKDDVQGTVNDDNMEASSAVGLDNE